MRLRIACSLFLAAGLAAAPARAQGLAERTVQLTVTSVTADSVYLDRGRGVGLAIGDIVQLFPPGAASLDVEVRSVSNTSARAELPPGMPPPPVGTRGEARVAATSPEPAAPRGRPSVPDHPPWTRSAGERDPDQPLLVPTFGERPDRRPASLRGRLFASGQWNRDQGGSRRNDYLLARLGVRGDATNWFGGAERVRFAGEIDSRSLMLPDAPDRRDENGRLDLLSVAFGTEAWAPTGVEVGRFYSQGLPELGLVDGLEVVGRYEGGIRAGAGLGAYPRPFPARATGDDYGAHAFFDYTADDRRSFAATIGLQKTWHRGDPDRDLFLLRLEGRPGDRFTLFGSAKVDFYTGRDAIKGSGLEVTEALGSARWDGIDFGTGVTVSHFAWPELLRAEYQDLPVELVRDGAVDRASWQGWLRPSKRTRLRLRADFFRDQDDDGTALALDGDVRDVIGDGSALLLSVFRADGGHSSGPGARATLRAPLAGGSWRLGYRWHRYDLDGLATGSESYSRQSAQLGLSLPIGRSGHLDASVERWFGDREDAWSLGLYVQWRF